MKNFWLVLFLILNRHTFAEKGAESVTPTHGFIENKGQIIDQNNQPNHQVLYLLNTPGLKIQLRRNGFSYEIQKTLETKNTPPLQGRGWGWGQETPLQENDRGGGQKAEDVPLVSFHRIDLTFQGCSKDVQISAFDLLPGLTNYYTTGTSEAGVINVRTFSRIVYKDIYPNVDIEFLTDQQHGVKYNILVRPNGSLGAVKLKIGGTKPEITERGGLLLPTETGTIEEVIPSSFYELNGIKVHVSARFSKLVDGSIGIVTREKIPKLAQLVIDPIPDRVWGSYYGGSEYDASDAITVDPAGNCYMVGTTNSFNNIASAGAYQGTFMGTYDGFLVKFNANGLREWGTYYGGTGNEGFSSVAYGVGNLIFATGSTTSTLNIATSGSFQPSFAGVKDAFLVSFSTTGIRNWASYYGSVADDEGRCCVVDNAGNIYLLGNTLSSTGIATPGSYQTALNSTKDAYLVKFTPGGNRIWGTYYGGECDEYAANGYGCEVDGFDGVYICGTSCSLTGIATPGAYQSANGGSADGFFAKFDTSGTRLYGTYLGGPGDDIINSIRVTTSHRIALVGEALSATGIATPGSFQSVFGGAVDAFVARFTSEGAIQWCSYYGSTGNESAISVDVSLDGSIYMAGQATSTSNIATAGAFQTVHGGGMGDGMMIKFDSLGNRFWGTYYGGSGNDQVWGIREKNALTHYLMGRTPSTGNIATSGTQQPTYGGGIWDGFLAKFSECTPLTISLSGLTTVIVGQTVTYSTEPGMNTYNWSYSTGGTVLSGGTTTSNSITIQWNVPGNQWVGVNYFDNNDCTGSSATLLNVTVYSGLNVSFTTPDTVCVNTPINIVNTTTGGSTYYWNFCSGNVNNDPTGLNIGNPGSLLNIPTYITLVKENNDCYSFISCQQTGVVRYYHGNSFRNNPISWTNIGKLGIIDFDQEGIQVKYDNGQWYGFVNSDTTVIRLDFGNSLANMPTAVNLNISHVFWMAHGLSIIKEGNTWIGFITCSLENKIFRLNFGSSLSNLSPTLEDFGNPAGLISPGPICIVEENNLWYLLISAGGNTLSRMEFGNSLLNMPTGQNLGNPGGFNNQIALTILRDCESTYGYYCNYIVNGQLGKLNFPSGVSGLVTGQLLGNIGGLNRPAMFSEIFRMNDTLYAYITNRGNGTLTRLTFPPCTNASVGSSTQYNPPPFSYNTPGTYNIRLIVDEGSPTQGTLCKNITVVNPPSIQLGADFSKCPTTSFLLDAGPGFDSYLWSNGATTQSFWTQTPGTYWVTATRWGCSASDTITMLNHPQPIVDLGNDTTTCQGNSVTFDAGFCVGCTYQWNNLTTSQLNISTNQTFTTTIPGQYEAIVTNQFYCWDSDVVNLFVNPPSSVSLTINASQNQICSGNAVLFTAIPTNPGSTPHYQWKVNGLNVGSDAATYSYIPLNNDVVTCTLTSSLTCASGNPATSNLITMVVENSIPAGVTISSSQNPICPGASVTYTATPFNGGSAPSYQWKRNGISVGSNSSTYLIAPAIGDTIRCVMTSNLNCVTANPASSNSIVVTSWPVPAVSFTPCFDTMTTTSAKRIKLKGGIPLGGTYSGTGVSNGYYYPNIAGVGLHQITYSYANSFLCTSSQKVSIHQYTTSAFVCGNTLTDIRDNNKYPTILIGSQCWMATNLNFGNSISSNLHQRDNCTPEKYINPLSLVPGAMYQWDELMRYDDTPGLQGLCPPGWHVPTESDWTNLFANWTNSGFAGAPLKYSGFSGFNAFLAGVNHQNTVWSYLDVATFYWSSTPYNSIKAYSHAMNDYDPSVALYPSLRNNAFSVRCLKD